MFFTKWETASLDRAHLDGTNRTALVTQKITYPLGVTLDLATQHVYWVDHYMNYIERCDYDGKHRKSLKQKSGLRPDLSKLYSIALFENQLVVAEERRIVKLHKHSAEIKHSLKGNRTSGLLIWHRQRQPEVAHPCREQNGGCNHLCIPYNRQSIVSAKCLCAPGYQQDGQKKCVLVEEKAFLMYVRNDPATIKGIAIADNEDGQESMVPIVAPHNSPMGYDYNVRDQLVYFGQMDK